MGDTISSNSIICTASYKSVKNKLNNENKLNYENKLNNEDKKIIDEILGNNDSTLSYPSSDVQTFKNKNKIKKFNLNILYYDEHLTNNEENSDNCSFIEMNTNGTFYGCHNFDLFKIVCDKIIKSGKVFILLSSGSSAEKIYQYCSNMKEIREFYTRIFLSS